MAAAKNIINMRSLLRVCPSFAGQVRTGEIFHCHNTGQPEENYIPFILEPLNAHNPDNEQSDEQAPDGVVVEGVAAEFKALGPQRRQQPRNDVAHPHRCRVWRPALLRPAHQRQALV